MIISRRSQLHIGATEHASISILKGTDNGLLQVSRPLVILSFTGSKQLLCTEEALTYLEQSMPVVA